MNLTLLASCTTMANPKLQEIIWCAITEATGGAFVAMLLLFIIFLYGLHLAKVPAIPSVAVGLTMIYVFNLAGNGIYIFETINWFAIIAVGTAFALFLWGFGKK